MHHLRVRVFAVAVLAMAATGAFLAVSPAASAGGGTSVPTLEVVAGIVGQSGVTQPTPGTATSLPLDLPFGVATDSQGDFYEADLDNYDVSKTTPSGELSVVVGQAGVYGGTPPTGPIQATSAHFYELAGLALDGAGNLYVSDSSEDVAYKVTPSGILTKLPITGLSQPNDLAVDAEGDLFVANASSGQITEYSSAGQQSTFKSGLITPRGIAVDPQGDVYVAQATPQGTVVKITPGGTETVVAGNIGGSTPATTTSLNDPQGLAMDALGDIFVSTAGDCSVYEFGPGGTASVVAGTGTCGTPQPGHPALSSPLYGPQALAVSAAGNLYIADTDYNHGNVIEEIRGITSPEPPVPGAPTLGAGGSLTLPWTPVAGVTDYRVTVYINGVAQAPVAVSGDDYVISDPVAGDTYSFTVSSVGTFVAGPSSAMSSEILVPARTGGYWMVASDGGLFAYGSPYLGSRAGSVMAAPMVGMASYGSGSGYWMVSRDGGVFTYGDAPYLGSLPGDDVRTDDIVGMAYAPGGGYWLVGRDGGVFCFGSAPFFGSLPASGVDVGDIVGIAADPSGDGYWVVSSSGRVTGFGSARNLGDASDVSLHAPIVGIAADTAGDGYWLAGSDGGVFAYGDAAFFGSHGGASLNRPVVGIASTESGSGYLLAASDGGVFAYGDARFVGSMASTPLNAPVVGIATP